MSLIPLQKTGPLVECFSGSFSLPDSPPRALKSLARIIDNNLCHRCGSCVGICPTGVLGIDKHDYPIVKNLSACTDCDLCVKVCPGDELDVPGIAKQLYGEIPDIHDMHGHFEAAYVSHATDPVIREHSTSGGLITAMLVWLLEQGLIDGAIVISSDKDTVWKGTPIIARSREKILAASKSKYAISPTNITFQEIREKEGKYALVGLPCQIHGFHKAARLDKKIRDRVILTFGLFCHAAVEHEPMYQIWDALGETKKKASKFISRVGKHPGTAFVVLQDGSSKPVYFPKASGYRPGSTEILNVLYRLYTPARCLTCYDSTSEFADIAVGDPWMAPPADGVDFFQGYSFTLARTKNGRQFLDDAERAGQIKLLKITPEHARSSNTMMGTEKRNRAWRIIETRCRQGYPVPDYGIEIPRASGRQFILTELNMLSHVFCFLDWKKVKAFLLTFTFSPIGYFLLWANYKKREFRIWRRDSSAKFRRRIKGPSE